MSDETDTTEETRDPSDCEQPVVLSSLEIALKLARNPRDTTDCTSEDAQNMVQFLRDEESVNDAVIRRLADAVKWYQKRVHAIQSKQRYMRYPERKVISDIIANGETNEIL